MFDYFVVVQPRVTIMNIIVWDTIGSMRVSLTRRKAPLVLIYKYIINK